MLRKWWMYIEPIIWHDPDEFGVYELGDATKNTVYFGSGKILTSLMNHIKKNEFPLAKYYRFEIFKTEKKCKEKKEILLESYKKLHGKLPKYNAKMAPPIISS